MADGAAGAEATIEWRRARPLLGTLVDIRVRAPASIAHSALQAAFAEIAQIHRLMSFHEPASDVSRLNRAPSGTLVSIDARTATVLEFALALGRATEGVFDIAVADLLVEQGLLPRVGAATDLRTSAPPTPGAPAVRLERGGALRTSTRTIDLGGIAKGYAVDRAIDVLQAHGVESMLVNAGGDLRQCGPAGASVHLRDPGDPARLAASLWLHNEALASSATSNPGSDEGSAAVALFDGRRRRALCRGAGVSVTAACCMAADALTKVVLATGDARHAALQPHRARTLLYRAAPALASCA